MARPLAFDPDEKLQLAMKLFWQKGYANTSITDITDALGINRFSLYNTFGDKDALYRAALEHYNQQVFLPLLAPLQGDVQGMQAVDAYLENFARRLQSPFADYGCLLQDTATGNQGLNEQIRHSATRYFSALQAALYPHFIWAKQQGEIQQEVGACVNFTLMTIQAFIITRKSAGKKLMLQNMAFFREQIKHW